MSVPYLKVIAKKGEINFFLILLFFQYPQESEGDDSLDVELLITSSPGLFTLSENRMLILTAECINTDKEQYATPSTDLDLNVDPGR